TLLVPVIVFGELLVLAILRVTDRLPPAGLDVYGPLFLSLVLVAAASMSIGLLISSFVKTPQQANDLLSLNIMPQVLFGGALFAVASMNTVGQVISVFAATR